MPLETMLIGLIVLAVIVTGVIIALANSNTAETLSVKKVEKIEDVQPVTSQNSEVKQEASNLELNEENKTNFVNPVLNPSPSGVIAVTQHLKSELDEKNIYIADLESANDSLRFDNKALKKELMDLTEKYRQQLTRLDVLKEEMDAQVAILIKEKDMLVQQNQFAQTEQVDQWKEEAEDLRRTNEKLKELNTTLTMKSDMLQYELIKSRAQALGFERINQNYRQQIEEMTQQLSGVKQDVQQLSLHKNRLEEMLQEMKQEHENLTQKERLAQLSLSRKDDLSEV